MEKTFEELYYNGMKIYIEYEPADWEGFRKIKLTKACGKEFKNIRDAQKYIDIIIPTLGRL